jgi:NADH dehydrogenase
MLRCNIIIAARLAQPRCATGKQQQGVAMPSIGNSKNKQPHRIVIVGGGASGLELATRLGDSLGKRGLAEIVLVDRTRTHLWKPLLHAVAAGSLNIHTEQLDYLYQARWHYFHYCRGPMTGLDRKAKEITVGPVFGDEGEEVLPERRERYDTLVIAVGSVSNDFGTPGVAEHAHKLDNAWEAHLFHRKMINECFNANYHLPHSGEHLDIVIVGAGATGVELSAELHNTIHVLAGYGMRNLEPEKHLRITLLEAGERILPGLPEYMSKAVTQILTDLGIAVRTGERVTEMTANEVRTAAGEALPATLAVWAAGIRGPEFLKDLDGLESDRINRLVVRDTLQTTRDDDIFVMGDCAAAPWKENQTVPPRAQAAHQQAEHLAKTIKRRLRGQPPTPYRYRDFGSLVSLGRGDTVGNLMGVVSGSSIRLEGLFAKLMYISLYKMHLIALHGYMKTALDTLINLIRRQTDPHVKLH